MNVGGATVVNDLVFTATYNGKIYAYNKKTGELVWEYQAPGGINENRWHSNDSGRGDRSGRRKRQGLPTVAVYAKIMEGYNV
jgi:outer membrane protein assembly factor BamB